MSRFILGVTGASGAIYATRTAMHLKRLGHHVTALVTEPAKGVLAYEGQDALYDFVDERPDVNDFFAECASGSADYAGMAVVPCSMGTLGRIAGGTSDNLLVRSADVCLKERRPLVVVPREMPFNLNHLDCMARLARMGRRDSCCTAFLRQARNDRRTCGYGGCKGLGSLEGSSGRR